MEKSLIEKIEAENHAQKAYYEFQYSQDLGRSC